jgi:hypothetical protein
MSWSESLLERVDRVASRFEEELHAGREPRVEEALEKVSGPERAKLLFELLVVEIDDRSARGQTPRLEDYLARFADARDREIVVAAHAQATAPGRPRPGELLLDRYEVIAHLGSGGTGSVWRVRERNTGGEYALKVEPVGDPERLRRDYQLAEALRDDHIVTMRGLQLDGGCAYLCMDLVDGPDLKRWLAERGALPLELALGIAEQLAHALDQMQRKGLVHRDLKPANVVVARGREHRPGVPFVVLVDLGLLGEAEATVRGQSVVSPRHPIAGTPHYMAPEQWRGLTMTAAVDQWALAVIFYQLVTGRLPFPGTTALAVAAQVCDGDPLAAEELPAARWAALRRALSKDRKERYGSCMELICALRDPPEIGNASSHSIAVETEGKRGIAARPGDHRVRAMVSIAAVLMMCAAGFGVGMRAVRARRAAADVERWVGVYDASWTGTTTLSSGERARDRARAKMTVTKGTEARTVLMQWQLEGQPKSGAILFRVDGNEAGAIMDSPLNEPFVGRTGAGTTAVYCDECSAALKDGGAALTQHQKGRSRGADWTGVYEGEWAAVRRPAHAD